MPPDAATSYQPASRRAMLSRPMPCSLNVSKPPCLALRCHSHLEHMQFEDAQVSSSIQPALEAAALRRHWCDGEWMPWQVDITLSVQTMGQRALLRAIPRESLSMSAAKLQSKAAGRRKRSQSPLDLGVSGVEQVSVPRYSSAAVQGMAQAHATPSRCPRAWVPRRVGPGAYCAHMLVAAA
jgi:hypothetical protein